MGFKITKTVGSTIIVSGYDTDGEKGKAILDGGEWYAYVAEVEAQGDYADARARFDKVVHKQYGKLLKAAEALSEASKAKPAVLDPLEYRVVAEAQPEVKGQAAVEQQLEPHYNPHTTVLRALHEGYADRVFWANSTTLYVARA